MSPAEVWVTTIGGGGGKVTVIMEVVAVLARVVNTVGMVVRGVAVVMVVVVIGVRVKVRGLNLIIREDGSSVSESQTVPTTLLHVPLGVGLGLLSEKSAKAGLSCSKFLLCSDPSARWIT